MATAGLYTRAQDTEIQVKHFIFLWARRAGVGVGGGLAGGVKVARGYSYVFFFFNKIIL